MITKLTKSWFFQKANQSVIFLLGAGLLFRAIIAFWLYPTFDEAYYYLYSLHLDWSYFDHPFFVGLTTGFGPWLTGVVSQFTIRLGPLICYTGSLIFLYLTSLKLFSSKAAILTLAIATITPVFQIGFGILTLPDSPLMFFWSASLYCAADEFFRQPKTQRHGRLEDKLYIPSYRLSYLGILVGLACDSKYHGFVLGLGLIGFCLTHPARHSIVRSPWTWLGLSLFIITTFPIFFWNMQHDWVSFRFQSERAVPRSGYNLLSLTIVYFSEVAYLFPTLGFPFWWVSLRPIFTGKIRFFKQKFLICNSEVEAKQLLILWVSLPLILGFTFMGGYRQILPSWTMPGFWGTTLLLGQQAAIWEQKSRLWVRRWLVGSGIVIATILLIVLLHLTFGILQSKSQYALLGGFLPAKDDSSTELIDIQQLRHGFAKSPSLTTALHNSSFIFTNRYYLGGVIAMSLRPLAHTPITCFDIGRDLRGFAFWSKPDEWLGKDALYITTTPFNLRTDLMTNYRTYFDSLIEIETIPIQRGKVVINTIYVYQAKTLLKPYPRAYGIQ